MKIFYHAVVLLIILISFPKSTLAQTGKFRMDYNYVALLDSETKEWGDWKEGYNTFVINYNSNNDIMHIKADGSKVIYRKLSGIEEGTTKEGYHYQILRALDEDGDFFKFQLFDDPAMGAKIMYSNIMVQFSKQ